MKWRGALSLVLMVFLLVGTTIMAEGASVCPPGNVKYEIGGGYEYNDGSGWIEASEFRVCWGANEGYRVIGVCIYVGGPDKDSRQISLGPGDGCWNNPEKYGISHVVLYTEAIPEPTPTDVPPEPTPTGTPSEPTATATSTPTSTPSSTPTATPTATPTDPPPTPTEVAPTQTPKPTSTSEPTPTDVPPEPTPTDAPPESTSTPKPTDKPKTPVPPTEEPLPTPNGLPSTGGQAEPNSPLTLMVIVLAGGVSLAFFVLRRRKI
ncbi:MAG: hypothetical protein ACOYJ8_02055 [Patescibacteria group bacterium]|jgi:hypothetical protein